MFTGIIAAVGRIVSVQAKAGDSRLTINSGSLSLANAELGDSIAVNGVCLTAVELAEHQFSADVSRETLSRTMLASAQVAMPVNLELSLTPTTRMGGHIVSGHVDGIAELIEKKADARSQRLKFKVPNSIAKYIAKKGSICVDGISLTVNQIAGVVFSVNIVPHTLQETTLGNIAPGQRVNVEVDLLARYLERLLQGEKLIDDQPVLNQELLQNSGFF